VHRVSVRPTTDSAFRFSLVFALRPARAPVHTALLESPQTGPFPPGAQLRGESMGVVFEKIVKSHWNVNVHKELREEQRARFVARRVAEGAEPPPEVLAAVAAGAAGSVSVDAETSQKDARNSQDAKADAEATVGATGAEDVHGAFRCSPNYTHRLARHIQAVLCIAQSRNALCEHTPPCRDILVVLTALLLQSLNDWSPVNVRVVPDASRTALAVSSYRSEPPPSIVSLFFHIDVENRFSLPRSISNRVAIQVSSKITCDMRAFMRSRSTERASRS
jgi:hypothetical protein